MVSSALAAIDRVRAQWEAERDAAREEARAERLELSLAERVERGIALKGLVLDDTDASPGGRALLWFKLPAGVDARELRLGIGEPVRLWVKQPDGPELEQGVIARLERGRVGIAVTADYGEFLEDGAVNLDREAPEITFERGFQALARLRDAKGGSRAAAWREAIYGEGPAPPEGSAKAPVDRLAPFDPGLNDSQLAAVQFALDAPQLALIHGPPGTGKTRTLVEIVRQCLRRSERLLLTAASNTAVDTLAERLLAAGVPLLRLGHPARVASSVAEATLDAKLEKSEARKLARRLGAEANELRRRVEKRRARGTLDHRERRELLAEARGLAAEARGQLDLARELIFREAKVVCSTAAGADPALLARFEFDRVILDEATQAADPIALLPLLAAPRAVLAGDPCQLSPTLRSRSAAEGGLGVTMFERLADAHRERVVRLLDTQYRMHAQLMQFPSLSMYAGKLRAAPEVAARVLHELPGVVEDPARPGPLVFLDTAGKGWTEYRSEDQPSTSNPGQAERVAAEVRRLLQRGLSPRELAVITPYDAQVKLLREQLRDALDAGLEVGTVDGFQGREKEAIVVDLVRSNDEGEIGFLADVRRMNVAITRAKRFLMVVGDSATLASADYYSRFMDAAEAQNATLSAWADDGIGEPGVKY